MPDLLTFPIGAVNFCLSKHFQEWLSVWSEQLPAKCVCQLRRRPLPFCCPKKIKRTDPRFIAPLKAPRPQTSPPLPTSLLPTSSFPFSHDSSAGKPTINDLFGRPSVWDTASPRAQLSTRGQGKKGQRSAYFNYVQLCSADQRAAGMPLMNVQTWGPWWREWAQIDATDAKQSSASQDVTRSINFC